MSRFNPVNRITQNLTPLSPKTIGISPYEVTNKVSKIASNNEDNLATDLSELAQKLRESTKAPLDLLSRINFTESVKNDSDDKNSGKPAEGTIDFDEEGKAIITINDGRIITEEDILFAFEQNGTTNSNSIDSSDPSYNESYLHQNRISFDESNRFLDQFLKNLISPRYDLLDLLRIPKKARPEDPQVN